MSFDKRLLAVYGGFEILLLLASIFMGKAWFFSSQVGFFASLLILFASFRSYKNRVLSKVDEAKLTLSDDDEIYGDVSDEEFRAKFEAKSREFRAGNGQNLQNLDENLSLQDENLSAKELLKREKALAKKNIKFENLQTAFVPFRLISYVFLVVGFLALKTNSLLDLSAFLLALGVMPLGALIYGVMIRGD